MEQLADVRKVKVKEAYEKASIKLKATGTSKAPSKAQVPRKSTTANE